MRNSLVSHMGSRTFDLAADVTLVAGFAETRTREKRWTRDVISRVGSLVQVLLDAAPSRRQSDEASSEYSEHV
jgi:hypothetical protein